MKINHVILIVLLTGLLMPHVAIAQETEDLDQGWPLELTLSLGSISSGDMELDTLSTLFLDTSYLVNFKASYYIDRVSAFEAGVSIRFDEAFFIKDTRIAIDPEDLAVEDFVNYHFTLGYIYNMGDLTHVPFIGFGVGLTSLNFSDKFNVPNADAQFTIFGNIGYKYYLSEWFAARIELGTYLFNHENLAGDSTLFMNWYLQAGATFRIK